MKTLQTDVVIVGKGIAGLCLSLLLERQGIEHLLLSRRERKEIALAETLPPSALQLLERLGFRALFSKSALKKTLGYHSLWGTPEVVDTNFYFYRPFQHGLKLDKQKLLRILAAEVPERVLEFDKAMSYRGAEAGIHTGINGEATCIKGKLYIDATGRNRAFLKQLGVGSIDQDQQLAFSCHLPRINHPRLVHDVFTEIFPGGWGIVSGLNEQTNVMTLFAEKGSPNALKLKDFGEWEGILKGTRYLKTYLSPGISPTVKGSAANSSRAEEIAGANWLAVGDAAIAFDPLSSHGISNAVYCAWRASEAVQKYLSHPQERPLLGYAEMLSKIFEQYLAVQRRLRLGLVT